MGAGLDNTPLIISDEGDIELSGNSQISMILYAPNGNIELSGNAKIWGAVIGHSVDVSGNAEVKYDTGLQQRSDLPGSGGPNLLSLDRN